MSANSPNPLVPQGSLEKQTSKAKSNVKVAVYSIVAVHAVLIFGVLMQGGCKKDEPKAPPVDTIAGQPTPPPAGTNDAYFGSPTAGGPASPTTDPLPPAATPVSTPVTPAPAAPAPAGAHPTAAPAAPTVVDSGMIPAPAASLDAAGPVQQYKVVKGDVAYVIAKKNKTTVAKLTAANPGVDIAKLKIGQTLNIPAPAAPAVTATATTASAPAAAAPEATGGATTTYEVKSGDTLFGISKKTGASVKAIRTANNMKTDRINAGMKLKIPAKATAAATPTPEPVITTPAPATPPPAPMTTTSAPVTPVRSRNL